MKVESMKIERAAFGTGIAMATVGLFLLGGCAKGFVVEEGRTKPGERTESVAGMAFVYRFDSGRTYEARYGCDTVHFTLLKPIVEDPPSRSMPYSEETLRAGQYLVIWDDPDFSTTFLFDVPARRLYVSAWREEVGSFLQVAELTEVRRPDDPSSRCSGTIGDR